MPRTKATFQQIRDRRRMQILQIAPKVFVQKGFAGTKISDLAKAAGISQGLLYRYFADKEEVLGALLEESTRLAITLAEAALERPQGPWEGLYWLTKQLLEVMRTQPDLCYCFSQVSAVPGILRDVGASLDTALRGLIVAAQAKGEISKRDPDQLVLLYLCMIQGIAAGSLVYGERIREHFPDAELVLKTLQP